MCKIFSNIPIFTNIYKKFCIETIYPANRARKLIEKTYRKRFRKIYTNKWTVTCELCYERGHKPVNCTAPKQNKKFIE